VQSVLWLTSPRFRVMLCSAHCALLSFPTRRSSDLLFHLMDTVGTHPQLPVNWVVGFCAALMIAATFVTLWWSHRRLVALIALSRSEEHTSELQSRENLVCRLLLEKKKKYTRSKTRI